jgi:hypothetical protein
MTKAELRQEILKITDQEELRNLNRLINWQFKNLASVKRFDFQLGQMVQFDAGRKGGLKTGQVVKVNRLKAKVKVGTVTWNVPFTMLQKVA